MKKRPVLFLILLLLAWSTSRSQGLTRVGGGPYQATEVVAAEGLAKPLLYSNQVQWLYALPTTDLKITEILKDSLAGKITANAELILYAQSGVLRKVAGSITYKIQVEVKEEKYRYAFTDFLYHYYSQNRNYQMVKNGKTKFLEDPKAPGWQKLWNSHHKTITSGIESQIAALKTKMVEVPKTQTPKAEEKKIDW